MRLAPLFTVVGRYGDWQGPPGAALGQGEGRADGDRIRGAVRWANYLQQRADGVYDVDIRGVIQTDDEAAITLALHALAVPDRQANRVALTGWITFRTADERYAWANTTVGVAEAWLNKLIEFEVRILECLNEASGAEADRSGGQ